MPHKFAFTKAALAAALEETPISYEDLADIERDFDDAETEIICKKVLLTQPLYTRRSRTVSQIPNFWALVVDQAPPDIKQYIQPSDSALLLSSLVSLSVSNFEIDLPNGNPRSVSICFEFGPNEYFTDTMLEKKFWHRQSKDGWSGLVSEPVKIHWKKDRDLTGGLLDMVCAVWEVEKSSHTSRPSSSTSSEGLTAEQTALKKKIDNMGMGGFSFFAWFGFIGRKISAQESIEAVAAEREKRETYKMKRVSTQKIEDAEDKVEEEDGIGMGLEIFPDGDDLAVAFTEDLWPGAIKYFTQAQEQDAVSDTGFESDDNEDLSKVADNSEDEPDNNSCLASSQRSF